MQRPRTPLNPTLSDDDQTFKGCSPILSRYREITEAMQSSGSSRFRQPPPLLEGFPILSQDVQMQLIREEFTELNRQITADAAARALQQAEFNLDIKRRQRSICQQEELYLDDWIEDPEDTFYTLGGSFIDDLAIRVKDLRVQLYRVAGGVGLLPIDFDEYHDVATPSYRRELILALKDSNHPIYSIPLQRELVRQVRERLKERQKEL